MGENFVKIMGENFVKGMGEKSMGENFEKVLIKEDSWVKTL